MPEFLSRSDVIKGHPTPSPRRIGKGEGRAVHPLGLSFTWKVTGDAFAVCEMEMPSEASIPLHTHAFAEFCYVLDGALEVSMLAADRDVVTVLCRPANVRTLRRMHRTASTTFPAVQPVS